MNLPNLLTIARMLMAVLFAIVIGLEGLTPKVLAAILFLVASATDYLDGYIARKYNLKSDLGALLDPIADKMLILIAFLACGFMSMMDLWMFIVIAIREIGITIWRLNVMQQGKVHAAESLGKYKTASQMVTISFVLILLVLQETDYYTVWGTDIFLGWMFLIRILMYISVALTLISGLLYLLKNRKGFSVR